MASVTDSDLPEILKQDLPPTWWGKVLAATPVALTVISTLLAGLSSSEMTRAQYVRSLGAQQQSKAGDQWNLYQARRIRGAVQRAAVDVLQTLGTVRPFRADPAQAPDPAVAAALERGALPPAPEAAFEPELKSILALVEAGKRESELAPSLVRMTPAALARAVEIARARSDAFDAANRPIGQGIEAFERSQAGAAPERLRDLTAARLRWNAARFDAEARLNQAVAQWMELEVQKSNQLAERHERRSRHFFTGMLLSQAAVMVSTFSLAARKRSILWSLAAAAGVSAVSFAVYVFLFL